MRGEKEGGRERERERTSDDKLLKLHCVYSSINVWGGTSSVEFFFISHW